MSRPAKLAATLGALLVCLGPAAAAQAADPFARVSLTATTSHGSFRGTLAVSRVYANATTVLVSGRLTGRVRDSRYPSPQGVDTRASIPVALPTRGGAGGCRAVSAQLGRGSVNLDGLPGTTNVKTVALRPRRGSAATRELLCGLAGAADAKAPPAVLAHLLSALRLLL